MEEKQQHLTSYGLSQGKLSLMKRKEKVKKILRMSCGYTKANLSSP
jgi:hypothetical protein